MVPMLKVLMIVTMVLGMAPPARADSVLVTAPLSRAGVVMGCLLTNAGTTSVDVSIEMVDPDGNIDAGPSSFGFDPGEANGLVLSPNAGSNLLYCRFTIRKGNKKKVRAHACAYSGIDLNSPCLSTAEAR